MASLIFSLFALSFSILPFFDVSYVTEFKICVHRRLFVLSQSEFQERLQRIQNVGVQQDTSETLAQNKGRSGKVGYISLGVGGVLMFLGISILEGTNENYEAIRDGSGTGVAALSGIAGAVIALTGILLILRAVYRSFFPSSLDGDELESAEIGAPAQTAKRRGRLVFSLLGVIFGVTASIYVFLAAAARFVDTEKAQLFVSGGTLIALGLFVLSLLLGMIGFVLRGYALGRVPLYFLISVIVSYSLVQLTNLNALEWDQFVANLQ